MLFDGPEQPQAHGFVGIETAERLRQTAAIGAFRDKHPEAYERLVKAAVAVKLARQELEASKAAAASTPAGVPMADLLDAVERESRERLNQQAQAATLAQLEQIGNAAATSPAKPSKKSS